MFDAILVPERFREIVSERAWLEAMLEFERALALAEARAGVIPAEAADAIAAACRADRFDPAAIAEAGRRPGNPAEPLVRALREQLEGEAADFVHWGATSQDVLDTATALVARDGLDLLLAELDEVARTCAALAEVHRDTLMAARTLLQHAVPTTFGLRAAGWLVAVVEAREGVARIRDERLAVELGGAAGTLAALGSAGPEVVSYLAKELELPEPVLPWHANRLRIAELASAVDLAAGALEKIALDVVLLSQTDVGEVAEAAGGGSSTMPQKRNPVSSAIARACASQVHGTAGVLTAALPQELDRAAGAWHSEWPALSGLLAYVGGAAAGIRRALDGLEVDVQRMRENLDATAGLVLAERIAFLLAPTLGRRVASELVTEAAESAREGGSLLDALLEDSRVDLSREELEAAFDPAGYLGSAGTFVERALALHRAREEGS